MKRIGFVFITLLLLSTGCTRPVSTALPDSSPTVGTALCAASDLGTSSNSNGASGDVQIGVTLVNNSKSACLVIGPPQVTLLAGGHALDVQVIQTPPNQTPPAPAALTIAPGNSVIVILLWQNYCGPPPPDGVTVHLALTTDQALDIPLGIQGAPLCGSQGQPSTLTVAPYSFPP
jgi:hypothetical protein